MERNLLTEEEAIKRVAAQVDNETVVKHSNVVFSSMWSYEFSQLQVHMKCVIQMPLFTTFFYVGKSCVVKFNGTSE